jgi:hypothetical protein
MLKWISRLLWYHLPLQHIVLHKRLHNLSHDSENIIGVSSNCGRKRFLPPRNGCGSTNSIAGMSGFGCGNGGIFREKGEKMTYLQRRRNDSMGQWMSRLLVMAWVVGMMAMVVQKDKSVSASENSVIYLPLIHQAESDLHNYSALVGGIEPTSPYGQNYYTLRGDESDWTPLVVGQNNFDFSEWSPDGTSFLYSLDATTPDGSTWVMDVATRISRKIFPDESAGDTHRLGQLSGRPGMDGRYWSPNSRYIALFGAESLYVFDVTTNQLEAYPIESIPFNRAVWSPNSNALAWANRTSQDGIYEVWIWHQASGSVQRVYMGQQWGWHLYWSPNGTQLVFTVRNADETPSVFGTTVESQPAQLLIDGYVVEGWVEGGRRLLLSQGNNLYLSQADGSSPTLFFEGSSIVASGAVFPSPTGTHILFSTYASSYIQATTSSIATPLSGCDTLSFQWHEGGKFFTCNSYTFFGSKLGDATLDPPAFLFDMESHRNPQFLPNADGYFTTNHYVVSPTDSPEPTYEGSYLWNTQTGLLRQLTYADASIYPVVEWRYMP